MWPNDLKRNISVLAFCQALFFMANTIVISTSPLVGLYLAPDPGLATVPLGFQFLGTMATTMPASFLMRSIGRRRGLALGTLFGVAAGLCGTIAIVEGSFLLFLLAALLYGAFGAFCQYYRFTAADAADHAHGDKGQAVRGKAISLVMAGGIVAALLGPELAKATQDLIAPFIFAGCYATVAVLALVSGAALLLLDLPHIKVERGTSQGRPLLEIMRQPQALTAVLTAIVGYVSMNLLMTATPLAMMACGHSFADSAFVIQWHVLGMFAPSFFTGHLIARFGTHRMILAGVLLIATCIGINLSGVEVLEFAAALFALGLGWNFMFIGGTTLLTACHSPAEKAKLQGFNELLLFGTVAISASSSGALHDALGWQTMNLLALPPLFCIVLLLLPALRSTRANGSVSA